MYPEIRANVKNIVPLLKTIERREDKEEGGMARIMRFWYYFVHLQMSRICDIADHPMRCYRRQGSKSITQFSILHLKAHVQKEYWMNLGSKYVILLFNVKGIVV